MKHARKLQDYTGLKKHRLTFLEKVGRNEQGNSIWKVRCECGTVFNVIASNVLYGSTYSCGCYRNELNKKGRHKHNFSRYELK